MSPALRVLGVAALLLVVGACSSSRSNSLRSSGDNDLITIDEIGQATSANAFELIQAHHPLWLRKRGRNSILNDGEILVYQDNVRLGGIDVLRQMPLMSIRMIRYYDSTKAQQRYGTGHDHGVIQVLTLGGGSR